MVDDADMLAERFAEQRGYLIGVAYRLTSTVADAEDAVAESWLRLQTLSPAARAGIRDLRAWLTTVVARICLDRLRSAPVRRERYVGPWLPEPLLTAPPGPLGEDPADVAVREDGLRIAALLVLDRLTPPQRVAFVLHDAFGMPFDEIAELLGCSVPAARQHASRARRAIADADLPPRASVAAQQETIGRLLAAIAEGDLASVAAVLHPDVTMISDTDGKAHAARRPITGADKIVRLFRALFERYGPDGLAGARMVRANGGLGMVIPGFPATANRPALDRYLVSFDLRDGVISAIYAQANPDKLTVLDR